MNTETKQIFIDKYASFGTERFLSFILEYAHSRTNFIGIKDKSPEMELLNYSFRFLSLYRREGNAIFLDISKLFRKAAHIIYRNLLERGLIQRNKKFLNLVV